jgi:uncharacterized OsmC-like protein
VGIGDLPLAHKYIQSPHALLLSSTAACGSWQIVLFEVEIPLTSLISKVHLDSHSLYPSTITTHLRVSKKRPNNMESATAAVLYATTVSIPPQAAIPEDVAEKSHHLRGGGFRNPWE